MQAIIVKVLPCTNTKPTRLKAYCERGSITLSRSECGDGGADLQACEALKRLVSKFLLEDWRKYGSPPAKNPWRGPWVQGYDPHVGWVHTNQTWKGAYTRIDTIDGKFVEGFK